MFSKLRGVIGGVLQYGIGGPWLKNASGAFEARNAADSAPVPLRAAAETVAVSGATTLGSSHLGKLAILTASADYSVAFASAAALGAGWWCRIANQQAGADSKIITLDPSGSETIDGLATRPSVPGERLLVWSDGANLRLIVERHGPGFGHDPDSAVQAWMLGSAAWQNLRRLDLATFWNPGSVAIGAQTSGAFTVPGATMADFVSVSCSATLSGLHLWGEVTATDTVTIYLSNATAGAVDLANANFYIRVEKYAP